jgi:Holliday junction resolvase
MVNFKYLSLPLLVGLLYGGTALGAGTCEFVDDNGTPKADPTCTATNDGYHYVETDATNHEGYIAEYKYDNNHDNGIAKTDTGFYKLKSGKYASCAKNICKVLETPTVSCTKENIGKLVNDSTNGISLCLAEYEVSGGTKKYPTLKFADNTTPPAYFLVQHKSNTIFNLDVSKNYYVVEPTKETILLNTVYSSTGYDCAKASTSKIVGRIEDLCSADDSTGKYFECVNGECLSYKQDKPDVQESNGEICKYNSSSDKYEGNCSTSNYYVIDNNKNIVITTQSGTIIKLTGSNGVYAKDTASITPVRYNLNADVSTKETYPLIDCGSTPSATCKLMAVDAPGYYLNSSESQTGIECTSKTTCSTYSTASCTSIGKFSLSENKFCESATGVLFNVDKEFLITVESGNFPGVTTKSNIAVKLDKTNRTIKLVEKSSTCISDNDIVKKENGKFYYCTNNVEIEMKDNGAVFVNKNSSNKYQLVKIKAIGIEVLTEENLYEANKNNEGYYVDRSTGANGIVYCTKKQVADGQADPDQFECTTKSFVENDVFVNKEVKFPINKIEHNAKLIHCTGGKCEVKEDKFGKGLFFTNSLKGLIECSESLDCEAKDPKEENNKPTVGNYINGIKNRSLIVCKSEKYTEEGTEKEAVYCETKQAEKSGYYLEFNKNLIVCGEDKCVSKAPADIFEDEDEIKINTYLNSEDSDDKIIECTEQECNKIEKPNNYFVDDSQKALVLIKCDSTAKTCKKVSLESSGNIYRGVFISNNGKRLIKCEQTSCKIIKDSDVDDNKKENKYYLNGETGTNVKPLIHGNQPETPASRKREAEAAKWELKEADVNGIYINENKEGIALLKYPVIYCTGKYACNEIEDDDENAKFMVLKDNQKSQYISVKKNDFLDFPTYTDSSVAYIVDKNTSKILDEPNGNNKVVVCEYKENVWKCSVPTTLSNYYVNPTIPDDDPANFGDKNLLITSSNTISEIIKQNDLTNGKNGYYINSSSEALECSTSGCEKYSQPQEDTWCSELAHAGTIKENTICTVPDGSNPKKATLTQTTTRYIIGTEMKYVDNKKVLPVVFTEDTYYLINNGNYGKVIATSNQTGKVYKCSSTGCSEEAGAGKTYPNSDLNTKSYATISCDKDNNCKYSNTVNTSSNVYCISSTYKLLSCKDNCDPSGCTEIVNKVGYYLPYEKNYLIDCNQSSCSEKKTNIYEGYYKSEDLTNQLIRCDKSVGEIRCSYATPNDGYYIQTGLNLISCKNNVCNKKEFGKDIRYKWFPSGDSENLLINCPKTGDASNSCVGYAKPKEGFYYIKEDNYMINCKKNKNDIMECSKYNPPYEGYFITGMSEDYLIKYKSNQINDSTGLIIDNTIKYYINGENGKLLKCKNILCEKEDTVSDWYIQTSEKVINCIDNKCAEYYTNSLREGYYLNGADDKLKNPILENYKDTSDKLKFKEISVENIKNGWYVSADGSIIQCIKSGNMGSCTKVQFENSCSTNSAKYMLKDGVITWCVNDNVKLDPEMKKAKKIIIPIKNANTIPWIKEVTGSNKFAVFEIDAANMITQVKIDGYYYDSDSNKLYFCTGWGYGLCEEASVTGGYYLDYTNKQYYRCNKNDEKLCLTIKFNEEDASKNVNCNPNNNIYNVVMDGPVWIDVDGQHQLDDNTKKFKFKLCNKGEIGIEDIGEVNINYVYSIPNMKFPSASTNYRYIMVDISKYKVTFKDYIKEVEECPGVATNNDSDKDVVCLKDKSVLLSKKTLTADSDLQKGSNIQINNKSVKKEIVYDYDTRNGYFIYKYISNKNELSKVYIKINENSKYECEIGSACIIKDAGEPPILGYELVNGIIRMKTADGSYKEVTTQIMDGYYYNSDKGELYYCINGKCEINEDPTIQYNNGKLTINGEPSTGLYNQYILSSNENNSKRDIYDGTNYYIMNELSTVRYSKVKNNERTNIFIDKDNKMISNEISPQNVEGYTCENGKCYQIDKQGNKKYFLNSKQTGKKENAIAVCGGGKCEFINANEGLLFENYAATGNNDALIKCTAEKCEASAAINAGGIPNCKKDEVGIIKSDKNNSCITENNEELQEKQSCISNGKIYTFEDGECEPLTDNNIKLFDATFRKLDTSKVNEKHYGASLYDCSISSKCYLTYGYVIGGEGYSKCSTIGCEYYNKSTLKSKCEVAGEGALINEDNTIKVCSSEDNSSDGYYPVTINLKNTFPEAEFRNKILVNVSDSGKIVTMVITDGYLLLSSSNAVITNNSSGGADGNVLYKCNKDSKRCEFVESPNYGYYRSERYDNIIECKNNNDETKCIMTDKNNKDEFVVYNSIKIGFSKSTTNNYYSVESNFPGYESISVIAEATKYSINILKTDNYVLINTEEKRLANKSDSLNTLYTCNSSIGKCELKYANGETISDGWYVSGQSDYKAIKCISGSCVVVDVNSGCKGEGDFIYNNNQYIFCGKTKAQIKITEEAGKFSQYSLNNIFPNGKNYAVVYANYVIGIGYIDEENPKINKGLPQCSSGCKISNKVIPENEYCIYNNKIYKYYKIKDEDTSPTCEQQFTTGVNVEIFKGSILANTVDNAKGEGNQMYYCKNGECSIVSGYKNVAGSYILCDYAKCTDSTGSKIGQVNGSSIKVAGGSSLAIEDDKYYLISGDHKFPGAETLDSFLVEVNSNYVVQFKGEGYYLISSSNEMLITDPKESTDSNESEEDNKLYYCNSTKICKLLESNEIGNGFYINSGVNNDLKYRKSIINCKNGNCVIANEESILFQSPTNNKCSEEQIGKLVRITNTNGAFQEYKMCIKKGSAPEEIKKTDDSSKFFVITLSKGSSFGSISVTEDDKSLIIEEKKDYIKQYNGEGYILLGSNGEILSSLGNANGSLYECKNSGDDGVKCESVTTPSNGWYFNNVFGDKRYIKYDTTSKFEILIAKEAVKCDSTGTLIYNEGFKLCHTLNRVIDIGKDEVDAITNIAVASNFPGISVDGMDVLLSVKSNAVYQLKMKTNVVVREDNIIDDKNEGTLYQCEESGECKRNEIPNDNYYLKTDNDKNVVELVYCEYRNCHTINDEYTFNGKQGVNEGFRVGSSRNYPLIQCILPEKKKEGDEGGYDIKGLPICKERELKEGWYLNAENPGKLIKCTKESGCYEVNGEINSGWYLNAAVNYKTDYKKITDKEILPIIQCTSNNCVLYEEAIDTSCTNEKVGNIALIGGKYKLCTGGTAGVELTSNTIDVINNNLLPEASVGYIAVSISDSRAIVAPNGYYLKGNNAMYDCRSGSCSIINSDDKNGVHLYENVKGVLMVGKCSNSVCNEWKAVTQEGNYVLNASEKLVTQKDEQVSTIYECIKVGTTMKCKDMKNVIGIRGGYYLSKLTTNNVSTNVVYNCDESNCSLLTYEELPKCTLLYYETNTCYISYKDEPDTETYSDYRNEPIISPGNICVSGNNVYFAFKEINTGIDEPNCLSLTSSTIVENYYYIDGFVYSANKYYSRNIRNYRKLVSSLDNTVLIGRTNEYSSIWKEDNNYMVKCNGKVCTKDNNEIPLCTYEYSTGKCKSQKSLASGQLCYSAEGNTYIIVDKSSLACINYKNGWGYSNENVNIYNYQKGIAEKYVDIYIPIDGTMYKINYNNEIYIMDEGVYIIDNANKLVNVIVGKTLDISVNSKFKMYVCTKAGCNIKNTCGGGLSDEYILYNSRILKCDAKKNTISFVENGNGYYLNGPWENVMKCTNGYCNMKNEEEALEGYYIDSGNYENIIKCTRENEKYKCVSEPAVLCNYKYDSSKDITLCKSKVNLKRNSYCLNIVKDNTGKVTQKPVMLYIENFIKAKDTGVCIENYGSSDIYYHYRKSKFLERPEKEEIIKLTNDAILKLYEKDLGYYIISTDTRTGVTVDTDLNKSRAYECTKTGCVEVKEPVDQRIYINKASSEKMIRYLEKSRSWEVIKHFCKKNIVNTEQCTLSSVILENDILYTVNNDNIKFKYAKTDIRTNNVVLDNERSVDVKKNTYLYIDNSKDGRVYIFDKSEQYFEVVSDPGYYIFKNSIYNMDPYKSTVNVTSLNDVRVLYKNNDSIDGWRVLSGGVRSIYSGNGDGYILNKADLKKEGLAIQIMNVPEKYTVEEEQNTKRKRDDDDGTKIKMKSVINKCTSTRKNSCQNTRDKQTIKAGEICVVVEGDYKGLYLAIDDIEKSSSSSKINCIRYDDDKSIYYDDDDYRSTYSFLGNNPILFAGMYHSKLLSKVSKNYITLFDDSYDGYYIIDNTEKKLITSTNGVQATAYKCGNVYDVYTTDDNGHTKGEKIEGSDRYECNTVAAGSTNKYYYDSKGNNVLFKSGKWNVENKKGNYYFYNEDRLSATINKTKKDNVSVETPDDIVYAYYSGNDGYYISSSNLDSSKVIIVNKDNGKREIVMNYNKCVITGNQCKPEKNDMVFSTGDVCYSGGKLYVVEVQEGETSDSSKTMCYSGSTTTIKYRLVDDELYRLDGTSVQILTKGIYVLNSSWEEYSTTYPEIPPIVIDCDTSDCAKVESLDIDQDVIINAAGTGVNRIMKYYPETNKFININKEGYYFFNSEGYIDESSYFSNAYYLTSNGELKLVGKCKNDNENYCLYDTNYENAVKFEYTLDNIYVNSVKEGTFIRYGSMYIDESISYDATNEKIVYNTFSGNNNGEDVFVFINGELFKIHPQYMEAVGKGLYVLQGSSPFINTEWTEITSDEELCYYTGSYCDSNIINEFKEQQYSINSATKKTSIVEYDDENQKWRMVTEDGIYFFFEDGYSITESNRRIWKVYEIVDGEVIDITESENRIGYYKYDELMIESNNTDGWEDAVKISNNVDVNDRRMCSSYELDETIDSTKLCYDDELGLCIPKSELSNDTIDSINCIFSYDQTEYYFLVGEKLYSISGQAFKNIKKNGLYVVGKNNKVYGSSLENKANAYKCENGVCKLEENLTTGYYLNMADDAQEQPTILYFNVESKTWRTTTVEGNYFFNGMGEAAVDGDDIKYAYRVENGGEVIRSIIDQTVKGVFINQSNENGNVIVEYKTKWQKAKEIPECTIGEDGRTITSEATLRTGDICVDGKSLIFITRGVTVTERKREETDGTINETEENPVEEDEEEVEPVIEEGAVIGISTSEDTIKYGFDAVEKTIVKMESGNIYKLSLNGYVVIGKSDSLAVESEEPVSAYVYKCSKGVCNEANPSANALVVNVIAEEHPLLKVNDNGKWSVVGEAGYYFFGTNYDVLAENGIVGNAIEVEVKENGKITQIDISNSKKLGIYVNKAAGTQMVVSNDEYFWSKGIATKKCTANEVKDEKGKACRTTDAKLTLQAGGCCIADDEFYVLIDEATSTSENANCISSEGKTKYITSEVISLINAKSTGDKLLQLSNDGIRVANEGYYYLNEEGEEVEQDNGEEITMYSCGEDRCDTVTVEPNVLYLNEKGEIFTTVETNLTKIDEPGLYFFNELNIGCKLDTDVVQTIIEVTETGNEVIGLDELKEGAYINSVNGNSIGIRKGDTWRIEVSDCKVENGECTSDSETLEVGSYCIIDSSIYFVNEVNVVEDVNINKCVKGSDENPFYVRKEDGEILVIKESSIGVIEDDGYYAFDVKNNVALSSSEMTESIFMKCEAGGECTDIVPEKMSNYLNRAPVSKNIVHFVIDNAMNATTIDTQCKVEGTSCTVDEGELVSGDLCVANEAIYLVKDDNQCISTEKYVERYQFVNNKIYKLGIDVVKQEFDGYYFMNGDNRAIGSVEDYAKSDTIGYMCSVNGDCYVIQPGDIRYFKDYASIENEKFNVVKFDPERISKRDEEGNSGYSIVEKEGIYKLDDGSYVDCAFETNGTVACKDIKEVGSKLTIDNEMVQCIKNEKKEIECTQATTGGYYMVDDVLKECEPNEDADQLICKDVEKEGYFIAYNKENLYECVETVDEEEEEDEEDDEIEISNIDLSKLNGLVESENVEEREEPIVTREEGLTETKPEGEAENEGEDEPGEGENAEENQQEPEEEGAVEENKPVEEPLVPVDVTCKPVECIEGNVLPVGAETGTELYVCVKVQKPEEEEAAEGVANTDDEEEIEEEQFRWVAKEDCESGSYLKKSNNFYKCEEEKENLDEEKIEKPNSEHSSTEGSTRTYTKKTTVSTTTEDITTTTTTTTTSSEAEVTTKTEATVTTTTTSKKSTTTTDKKTNEDNTTAPKTTTTKKQSSTTTTAPKPTNNEGGSGAFASRSIPSITLYIALFLLALFVHF